MRIIQGDYGFDLNFTITDSDGSALDLTNATITFKMALPRAVTSKVSGACTIDIAASGTCHYTLASGDTDTVGIYDWEVQCAYSTKVVTAKGSEQIEIKAELP